MVKIILNPDALFAFVTNSQPRLSAAMRVYLYVCSLADANGRARICQIEASEELKLSRSSTWGHFNQLVKSGILTVENEKARVKTFILNPLYAVAMDDSPAVN